MAWRRCPKLLTLDEIDIFFVGGQSNARGLGTGASSVTPSGAYLVDYDSSGNTVKAIGDPSGFGSSIAVTGSFIPNFVDDYTQATGRNVAIVKLAQNGSSQADWADSNGLLGDAITAINGAGGYFSALGITPLLKGVLWSQGETDASAINSATQTKAGYKSSFSSMIDDLRTEYGTELHLYMVRTGTNTGESDTGYSDIRDGQDELAAASSYVVMAHTDAVNFPGAGKLVDALHYSTPAQDEIGAALASSVVSDSPTGIDITP